jgi:phage gp36-like protein
MAGPVQYTSAQEFLDQENANGAFTGVPTPTLNVALQWASRKAATYIRKRKVLPLVSWGDDLKSSVARMAKYELVCNQGFAPLSGSNETIRERFEDEISWLKDVSTGNAELEDCVDSSTTPDIDQAGPLAASDTIVNWNYQTRGNRCPPNGDGLG